MNIAFSQRHIHFQEHQNMALFFQPFSTFWLYSSKKLIFRFFFNQMLGSIKSEL